MSGKKDLVEKLMVKLDYLSKDDATLAVDCVLEYMKNELSKNNRIEIRGFGSFSLRKKKYSSQDKKYRTIYFRPSKNIQELSLL